MNAQPSIRSVAEDVRKADVIIRRSRQKESGYSRYRSPRRPIGSLGCASDGDVQGAERTRQRRQVVEPWRHYWPKRPWCGLVGDSLLAP